MSDTEGNAPSDSEIRERGVLTQEDRKYLRGEKTHLEGSAEYNVQRRIRRRIRDSLLDFSYLVDSDMLSDRQMLQAIEDADGETQGFVQPHENPEEAERGEPAGDRSIVTDEPAVDPDIEDALLNLLVFSFRALRGPGQYRPAVEQAAVQAFERYLPEATITANEYTLEYNRPEKAVQMAKIMLEREDQLTDAQVRLLLEQEDVDPDRVVQLVREQAETTDVEE